MMKRIFSFSLLGIFVWMPNVGEAQIPVPPDPSCAYCGVDIKSGEAHKKGCKYYSEPEDDSSSSPSTHLMDYTPQQETQPVQPVTNSQSQSTSNSSTSSQTSSYQYVPMSVWLRKYVPYTSESEPAKVSEPLLDCPTVINLPQFSSINETNVRYDEPKTLAGKHEWGEMPEYYFRKKSTYTMYGNVKYKDVKYDIERYNHEGGPVILGIHQDNGRYAWFVLVKRGEYRFDSQSSFNSDQYFYLDGKTPQVVDVRYEGEGRLIIREYEGGYKRIFNTGGKELVSGYNAGLLHKSVDGKQLLYETTYFEKEDKHRTFICDEDGKKIAYGEVVEQYDDAIVTYDKGKGYTIRNWRGQFLNLEYESFFSSVKAFNDNGSYYIVRYYDHYAIIARGFRRVGGWYESEEIAHRVWRANHP